MECRNFLRTCVPTSISNRASLVPLLFSSDTSYTDDGVESLVDGDDEEVDGEAAILIVGTQ